MLLLCFSVCKRHKAFLPEFVYLCLLCNTASVILIKCSTLRLYGEWNNCSIGAKVTDSAYEHSELFSSQAPLLFWILVSCCQSLFQIKHIGVEGGRGETGYFVQKIKSSVYFVFQSELCTNLHYYKLDNYCFSRKAFVFSFFWFWGDKGFNF